MNEVNLYRVRYLSINSKYDYRVLRNKYGWRTTQGRHKDSWRGVLLLLVVNASRASRRVELLAPCHRRKWVNPGLITCLRWHSNWEITPLQYTSRMQTLIQALNIGHGIYYKARFCEFPSKLWVEFTSDIRVKAIPATMPESRTNKDIASNSYLGTFRTHRTSLRNLKRLHVKFSKPVETNEDMYTMAWTQTPW